MIRFSPFLFFLLLSAQVHGQQLPAEAFSLFPPAMMKKNAVKEVSTWRVAWDSTLSIFRKSNQLIIGAQEHHYAFDNEGRLLNEEIFITENKISRPYHVFEYTFDEAGRKTQTHYLFNPFRRYLFNKEDSTFTEIRDTIIRNTRHLYRGEGLPHCDLVFLANARGEQALPIDSFAFRYDQYGMLRSKSQYHELPGDVTGKRLLLTQSWKYTWDSVGHLVKETREDFGEVLSWREWQFDAQGRRVREAEYNEAGQVVFQKVFSYSPGKMHVEEKLFSSPLLEATRKTQDWYFDSNGLAIGYVEQSDPDTEPLCFLFRYQ